MLLLQIHTVDFGEGERLFLSEGEYELSTMGEAVINGQLCSFEAEISEGAVADTNSP